ncbi:MAG: hypothetical protein WAQ08_14775 [Aquabacterium sp.]|uniref:hypothetical protein n=1 Tax=Aquabacterium sp. TaxID=1872578 RepID=UPI003BAF5DCB
MPAPSASPLPTTDLTPPLPSQPVADHLVIPWAVALAEPQEEARPGLDMADALPELPVLQSLLARLTEQQWLHGDEYQLAAPHERLLANAVGWPGGEAAAPPQQATANTADAATSNTDTQPAQAPWAALWAHLDGLPAKPDEAWGLLTPSHWLMGRDHLTLLHPDELALSEAESRTLFDAVRPLFESEGWQLTWGAPLRWYVQHPSLAALPSASLDRVIGRNPDLWMPNHPQARLLRRLQNEVQMLLYQHPVNDARDARRALSVNSFWLSGTGTPAEQADKTAHNTGDTAWPNWPLHLADAPRQALLRGDLPAWQAAWQALDAGPLRQLSQALDAGRPVRLTLCGERHALTLSQPTRRPGLLANLGRALPWRKTTVSAADLLRQL